jgi:hypothetical protein
MPRRKRSRRHHAYGGPRLRSLVCGLQWLANNDYPKLPERRRQVPAACTLQEQDDDCGHAGVSRLRWQLPARTARARERTGTPAGVL